MTDHQPAASDRLRRPRWTTLLAGFFWILGLLQIAVAIFFGLAAAGRIQPAALGMTPTPLLGGGGAVFLGFAGFFAWMGWWLLRPGAEKQARCLHCRAKNRLDSPVCGACGRPLDAFRGPRAKSGGQRVIVRGDVFLVAAGLLLAALALVGNYRIVSAGLPDEIEAYVRSSVGAGRDVRITGYKALTVSTAQATRGVQEAWCVELADPTRPSGYAPYIVYRDSALRTAASPVARCRGLDRW